MARSFLVALTLTPLLGGCFGASEREGATETLDGQSSTSTSSPASQSQPLREPCPVTRPNGQIPPGKIPSPGSRYLGNGALWTDLYPSPIRPRPEDVKADGTIEVKFGWWRGVAGRLRIEGRRLDAEAPPLSAWIPGGYGRRGFQSSAITFPTAGCWQVTGSVADASLTFVTLILDKQPA
jgi:hypothetical protein